MSTYNEAQKFCRIDGEFALFGLCIKSVVDKALKNLPDFGSVLHWVVGEDQDVVQIDENVDVKHVVEDVVHEVLEYGRSIRQAEWHDEAFEVTVAGAESSLPFFAFFNANEIVCSAEVEFSENTCISESVQSFRNEGQWISVLDCNIIESSIVDAESELAGLLLDEKDGRSGWRLRCSDRALG